MNQQNNQNHRNQNQQNRPRPDHENRPGKGEPETERDRLRRLLNNRIQGEKNFLCHLKEEAERVDAKLQLLPEHSEEWNLYVTMSTRAARVVSSTQYLISALETSVSLIDQHGESCGTAELVVPQQTQPIETVNPVAAEAAAQGTTEVDGN